MAENRKTANREFISSKRGSAVYQRPQRVEEEPSGSLLELKSGWTTVRKKVQDGRIRSQEWRAGQWSALCWRWAFGL